jgi:hypothetical protein
VTHSLRLLFVLTLLGASSLACGPDRELLMDTKFDAALRHKMGSISENGESTMLAVIGKCTVIIEANMRAALLAAGADVQTMHGEIFTARVSSDDVYKVAALEFVVQLQLSKESNLSPK